MLTGRCAEAVYMQLLLQVGILVETWKKCGSEVISGLRHHTLPPAQVCTVLLLLLCSLGTDMLRCPAFLMQKIDPSKPMEYCSA